MCIYLNYLYLLSRMRTCLYYRIFTAKHAPCLYLHSTHYAYISISTYLLSRSAHVYIYNQACAMSKYTLIYAQMYTFKFPACADLYIYICGIYTCVHVHIYIYISPSAHVYSYIPRMCTMHISVLTYHRNVHVSYACVSRARMYLSCTTSDLNY